MTLFKSCLKIMYVGKGKAILALYNIFFRLCSAQFCHNYCLPCIKLVNASVNKSHYFEGGVGTLQTNIQLIGILGTTTIYHMNTYEGAIHCII